MIDKAAGWLRVQPVPRRNLLRLSLQLPNYARLKPIIERVHTMFDLGANPVQIERHLGQHPRLAPLMRRTQGLRLPGAWDGFEVAVRILVARDVGPIHAAAVMGKLAATYGQPLDTSRGDVKTLFPTATVLMQAPMTDLALSHLAACRIRRLARAVACGSLRFNPTVTFAELVSALSREADLDPAAAQWVAMRALGEPDADLFGAPSIPATAVPPWLDPTAQEAMRPWRSYAAVLLASP